MKNSACTVALVLIAAISQLANAQEEQVRPYSYATYFYCDVSAQEKADEIVKKAYAPAYDAAVKNGDILAWGWLAHQTGGKWRRILYHAAPTLDALLDTQQSIGDAIDKKHPSAGEDFGKICKSHDDYIWRQVTGSDTRNRGEAAFSVYFYCDIGTEAQADEIVKTVFAPIYNAHTGEGKLSSWGWLSHIVGGKYRRLATMTAADHKTLLAQRAAIIEALGDNELASTFNAICSSHQDYMWDVQIENP